MKTFWWLMGGVMVAILALGALPAIPQDAEEDEGEPPAAETGKKAKAGRKNADKKGRPARKEGAARKKPEADKKAGRGKREPKPLEIQSVNISLRDLFDAMDSQLKLTAEQKMKIRKQVASAEAVLAAWDKANAGSREAGEAELAQARGDKDAEAIEAAGAKVRALQAERDKVADAERAKAEALLTPEQQEAWSAYNLYAGTMAAFPQLSLDLDQIEKIRSLTAAAAKEVDQAADAAARAAAKKKLLETVVAEVLTQAQRDRLSGKKPEKAKGDKVARPRKGGERPKARKTKDAGEGGGDSGGF